MTGKMKRRSVAVGLFLVFALCAGGAYAYWTNSGTGTGTAATDSPAAGQLTVSGTAITGLAPGVAAKTLTGTIANSGTSDASVSSLSVTGAVDAGHAAGCSVANDYTIVQPTLSLTNVPAGGSIPFSSGSIVFKNTASNQNACKGATVTLTYTVG
jgi:copper(I)-binding protein